MSIANTVANYLKQNMVAYTVIDHPRSMSSRETAVAAHMPPDDIAKAVVLSDRKGYLMVVIPGDRHVELGKLVHKLGRPLRLADEERVAPVFKDCELGAIPPIGPAYNMDTMVDESLVGKKRVCFVSGDHGRLICVDGEDFLHLLRQARYGQFSH